MLYDWHTILVALTPKEADKNENIFILYLLVFGKTRRCTIALIIRRVNENA